MVILGFFFGLDFKSKFSHPNINSLRIEPWLCSLLYSIQHPQCTWHTVCSHQILLDDKSSFCEIFLIHWKPVLGLSLVFIISLPVSPQHFWRWLIQPWPHLKAAFQITWLTQNPHVVIPRLFPNLVQMYFFQNSDFKNLFLGYSVLIFQLTLVLVQQFLWYCWEVGKAVWHCSL